MSGVVVVPCSSAAGTPSLINQVVVIKCSSFTGTGFYVRSSLVITAKHVVANCKKASLTNNANQTGSAIVVFRDKDFDIAFLSTKSILAPTVHLDETNWNVGDKVSIVGTPIARLVMSEGTIVKSDTFRSPNRIYLDISADHGNSGGPVFSDRGVLGIVTSKSETQVWAYNLKIIEESLSRSQNHNPSATGSSRTTPQISSSGRNLALIFSLTLNLCLFLLVIFLGILIKKKKLEQIVIKLN